MTTTDFFVQCSLSGRGHLAQKLLSFLPVLASTAVIRSVAGATCLSLTVVVLPGLTVNNLPASRPPLP